MSKHDPTKTLRDREGVLETIIQCLIDNDLDSVQDLLVAHLRTVSKTKLAKDTGLGRQTLYDLLDPEIPFNPTISTFAPILKALKAA